MPRFSLLLVIAHLIIFSSCNSTKSSADIVIADIQEPCDCMEAYIIVSTEMIDLLNEFEDIDAYRNDKEANEKGEVLTAKYHKIDNHCDGLSFSSSDMEGCADAEQVKANFKEINQRMRL